MKLREEFEVAEPVASVWTFFESPEAVAQCVPGVEQLTVVTPDDIDVRLTQSIGPMTATFAATVKIVERVPEKLIAFTATGKTVRGAMGNVRATVTVQLEPVGDRTVVLVEGDVALAGALGSVGQKVVAKQAGKVTAQFSRNLETALGGGDLSRP
ncbi:MAG: carbon monoxide dehydrogenase subunit, partial [Modestobacter sp.]|nr:carbon monoxide dehydrogenase subunit [Modestobacter sp.]